jgi:hypothetical protein
VAAGFEVGWGFGGRKPAVTHVALDRRFVAWREDESSPIQRIRDPQLYAGDIDWKELQKRQRVVILAEAGSGKTEELRAQAQALTNEGSFAFYSTVKSAGVEGFTESLPNASRQRLATWLVSDEPAWFFIDSVDEAKLGRVELSTALRRVADAIAPGLRRAHIVLSGRITDWEFRADLERFTEFLPVPGDPAKLAAPTAEAVLGRALRGDYHHKGYAAVERGEPPLVVLMTTLDEARVRTFAAARDIGDSDPFIKAIEAADLWFLARRPLDLQWLITYWKRHSRFGTLASMIETSLQQRLRETNPQHAHDDSVDPVRAMQALERIGAAMVFGRLDKIAVEDSGLSLSATPDALRLEEILPDWAPAPRRQLLTRAIFDPATYGCVRLHNDNEGTVRAFLAARWLRRLRDREGSVRAQLSRLFTDVYGYPLIRPSLRLTTAWLSLQDPDVASEVIAREPDLLLAEGDPGSLSAAIRSAVLTRVIEEMARSGDRMGIVNDESLRRLAAPDLSPTVRTLWRAHKDAEGCRRLLLRLIALGALADCADIASEGISGAYDDGVAVVFAGRALMASADPTTIEAYANRIRTAGNTLPAQMLWEALDHLAPRYLSVRDFLSIVEGMDEQARTEWPGADYFVPRYAERLRSRADLEQLLQGLAALFNGGSAPDEDKDAERAEGHLKLMAKVAISLMPYERPSQAPHQVIDIAMRLRSLHRHRTYDETSRALIETLSQTPERRREVFWHVARVWADHQLLHGRPLDSVRAMNILGWPTHLQLEDLDWVLADTLAASVPWEANLGLDAALDLYMRNVQRDDILQRIRSAVASRPELIEAMDHWLMPRQLSAEEIATNDEMARIQAKHREQERKRDESWKSFIAELKADPDQLRRITPPPAGSVDARLFHLWLLLSAMDGRNSRYAIDDVRPVEVVLGRELTLAFRDALVNFWRQWKPTLESTRAPDQRNIISQVDCLGICAVSVESKLRTGWPGYFTSEEAARAAEYATLELNGFPSWTARLAAVWPVELGRVLLSELLAELDDATSQSHVGPLQDVETGPVEVCRGVAAGLFDALRARERFPETKLSQVLTILNRGLPADEGGFFNFLLERSSRAADPDAKASYLAAAFHRDPIGAVDALRTTLETMEAAERGSLMERLLPRLSGDLFRGRDHQLPVLPLKALEQLVQIAFAEIRVAEDVEHKNGVVFSPGLRDRAERARDGLFRQLSQVPGPATILALRRIGSIPGIPIRPDTIEALCHERAAADSEGRPWPPEAAYTLEHNAETPPGTAEELQALGVSRLLDLAHDLRHGDFTLGTLLKRLRNENEVQRSIANELRNRQGQAYSLEREPHVADEKEPDIRLRSRATDVSVPIEIKDTDSGWSLSDLERGLTEQLCGRYLRTREGRYGIYLIVHRHPRPNGWRDATGEFIQFDAVIAHLQALADSVQGGEGPWVRVCSIDVSDM